METQGCTNRNDKLVNAVIIAFTVIWIALFVTAIILFFI
jgi:hypothetical protein